MRNHEVEPQKEEPQILEAVRQKTEYLIAGMAIDPSIEQLSGRYKPIVHAIYGHFKSVKQNFRYPEELYLHSNSRHPSDVIVTRVRENEDSPFTLIAENGSAFVISPEGKRPVVLANKPLFYDLKTSIGTEVWKISQRLGTDFLGTVTSNYCSYFSTNQECRFCELVPTYQTAREYEHSVKPITEMQEAIQLAVNSGEVNRILLTSGNYDNENQRTINELSEVVRGIDTSRMQEVCGVFYPPKDVQMIKILKAAGFTVVVMDMETWSTNQFIALTPGKHAYLGREKLIDALDYAVSIFGPGHVYTSFIYGIQSLQGLAADTFNPNLENSLMLEGSKYFLNRGVIPLFTIYHSIGRNHIGQINIDPQAFWEFGIEYGKMVHQSGLVPDFRSGAYNNVNSIGNHPFNDFYYLAKQKII